MTDGLFHWFERIRILHDRRRTREALLALSDHHLADIGIERGTVDRYARIAHPWPLRSPSYGPGLSTSLQGCG